jgi:hypothetical protein
MRTKRRSSRGERSDKEIIKDSDMTRRKKEES